MSPDDPRHGTTRGYHAKCRCIGCRRAISQYEKGSRLRKVSGIAWAIPAIGVQRRIEALMSQGWTAQDIADAAGWNHRNAVHRIMKGQKGKPCSWVERKTYRTICETYERLIDQSPPDDRYHSRAHSIARGRDLTPPSAWFGVDIDDPEAEPDPGWSEPKRTDLSVLAEDFDWLVSQGESEHTAAARLGIKRLDHFKDSRRRVERTAS